MAVIVYVEGVKGQVKKSSLEAISFGRHLSELLDTQCIAVTIGETNLAGDLGKYGASRVINVPTSFSHFDSAIYTRILVLVAKELEAVAFVMSHGGQSKALAGMLSVKTGFGLVSGASDLAIKENGKVVLQRSVYSGKAVAKVSVNTDHFIVTVQSNSVGCGEIGSPVEVESFDLAPFLSGIQVDVVEKSEEAVPLPEAELVVSGGRGFKGSENWGILLDLAKELGAATACSRPVADSGWRPHHEHVGQTGVAIRPNVYIAIGISGAIQHLGGVNNSKSIIVINKDPEAPFFKAADFGVVGDLFEVVPKLTEAIRKYKSS